MSSLEAVHDKIEIKELLYRYARGVDTNDWDLLTSVFTDDAHLDYASVGGPAASRDEVVAWLRAGLTMVPMKMHYITNVQIALDGDRAEATAMFYNPMQLPGMDDMSACGGYYHHEVVRTADGWKSRHLREENVWFANRPGGR